MQVLWLVYRFNTFLVQKSGISWVMIRDISAAVISPLTIIQSRGWYWSATTAPLLAVCFVVSELKFLNSRLHYLFTAPQASVLFTSGPSIWTLCAPMQGVRSAAPRVEKTEERGAVGAIIDNGLFKNNKKMCVHQWLYLRNIREGMVWWGEDW